MVSKIPLPEKEYDQHVYVCRYLFCKFYHATFLAREKIPDLVIST